MRSANTWETNVVRGPRARASKRAKRTSEHRENTDNSLAPASETRIGDRQGAEETAVATVDRLVDRDTILRFTGKSLRDPLVITGAPLDE